MAAAFGIGRFAYTPILPPMIDALGWSKSQAGVVASANFIGYLLGAICSYNSIITTYPRRWLIIALSTSGATTIGMGLVSGMASLIILRFIGGAASAFVIVCGSTLVLDQLIAQGRHRFASIHFAGVGIGVVVSAALITWLISCGAQWGTLWIAVGVVAILVMPFVALLTRGSQARGIQQAQYDPGRAGSRSLVGFIVAYGLFGLGYVITATFLVTIVRQTPSIRALEPWIWILFGSAAIPSVPFWTWVGSGLGTRRAFALACVLEAIGVAISVELESTAGACLGAIFLGGTFMGLTTLGLIGAREETPRELQRVVALMTVSFAVGQVLGPTIAGVLSDWRGNFRAASLLAASALLVAAALALRQPAGNKQRDPRVSRII
jgi:MFS family permease